MITRCEFKRFTARDHKQTALTNQSSAWDALGNFAFRHLLEQRSCLFVSGE